MLVKFKSVEPFFTKEKENIKNNTVRFADGGERFEKLKLYDPRVDDSFIKIENPDTGENFTRRIRDVSVYEETFIITWEDHKND